MGFISTYVFDFRHILGITEVLSGKIFESLGPETERGSNKKGWIMACEIFRPVGLYLLTNAPQKEFKRIPVHSMGIGELQFPWDKKLEHSVTGVEIHGQVIGLHLPVLPLSDDRARVSLESLGLNFTLFNLWIDGLSMQEKEALISEVLAWQEEAQKAVYEQGAREKKAA